MRESGSPEYKLNTKHLNLDDVKSWLPQNFLLFDTNQCIYLSGPVGEPSLNPSCIDIVKYLSRQCNVVMDSNGSTQNEEWWHELGKTKIKCVFSPDSLKTNNNLYRINSNTEKVISNMKSFISGGGKASWKYIAFKHNEDELENQRKLAFNIGATFLIVQPDSFTPNKNILPSKYFPNSNVMVNDFTTDNSPNSYCKLYGKNENLIEISVDGIVYPCCFTHRHIFNIYSKFFINGDPRPNLNINIFDNENHVKKHEEFISKIVPMIENQGGIKSISLYHNRIENILKTDLYKYALKKSWDDKNSFCKQYCGARKYVFETS